MKTDLNLPRYWPVLFPLTYLVHIAEEYWCGGGFYNWSRVLGLQLTQSRFLELNAFAWTAMLLLCLLAIIAIRMRWVMICFAAAVLLNGSAHTIASIVTASYSPGLFSGLFLWVPLGSYTLLRAYSGMTRRAYWGAIAWGVVMHTVVTVSALSR